MVMGRSGRRTLCLVLFLVLLLSCGLAACGGDDRPPSDNTPDPPVLKGVYSGEQGSLTFNGDRRSIVLNISAELAAASGLPEGESEGSYVFLFHNEEWRYDKAESFRIGFFLHDGVKPTTIRISGIEFSDEVLPARANLAIPAK